MTTGQPGDDQAFPTLTSGQIARVAAHGKARKVERGEVLVKAGARNASLFVVVAGQLEVVRVSDNVESIVATHRPGQMSGEINTLSGRRAIFAIRAAEAGEVIEVNHDHLMAIVQTDADLSEILMRPGHPPRLRDDWGHAQHALAEWLRGSRRSGIHQDRTRPDARRPGGSALAARASTASSRNQPARSFCGWRRAGRQHQARCVSRR